MSLDEWWIGVEAAWSVSQFIAGRTGSGQETLEAVWVADLEAAGKSFTAQIYCEFSGRSTRMRLYD